MLIAKRSCSADLYNALALVGRSWRVDEAHIKVKGQWVYLYRAVDNEGQTVDFYLNEHRDIAAAKAFCRKAILHHDTPQKITLDGYQAPHERLTTSSSRQWFPAIQPFALARI